jgi:hypothetical protein
VHEKSSIDTRGKDIVNGEREDASTDRSRTELVHQLFAQLLIAKRLGGDANGIVTVILGADERLDEMNAGTHHFPPHKQRTDLLQGEHRHERARRPSIGTGNDPALRDDGLDSLALDVLVDVSHQRETLLVLGFLRAARVWTDNSSAVSDDT